MSYADPLRDMSDCPSCESGTMIRPYVSISRKDNETEICHECGLLEAFNEWREHERNIVKYLEDF
jgi:uncharacterized protein (DUF983 family)